MQRIAVHDLGIRQRGEQRAQVVVAVDAVDLAGLLQRIQVRVGRCTRHRVREEPVASPHAEWPDDVATAAGMPMMPLWLLRAKNVHSTSCHGRLQSLQCRRLN